MISDFLEHLLWEVRVNHAENTSLATPTGAKLHPELTEQLGKYVRQYNTALRPAVDLVVPDGMSREDAARAMKTLQRWRVPEHQRYINALETLQPLFKEALFCAAQSDLAVIRIPADRVLDGSFFGEAAAE